MSSPRLRTQFERLFEHFQGEDCAIQLEELTDILCCTRRNTRIVLNKLAEEGWIEWVPAAGRGKLSRLIFKRNKIDVSENLAKRYLEEGKIEHALSVLDNDPARLTQVFQGYLGFSHLEGQQVIRLPYYRQLATLNPLKPTRRSEQHIIRQIFSGLIQLDEKEQVQPDLAHHWEMLSPTHWRFYLRSGVRFHNGDRLNMTDVIESINRLKTLTLFEHIESVASPSNNTLDIHLTDADYYLPLLLTETPAKILQSHINDLDKFDLIPNGTGPYKVTRNDSARLVLEAFEHYFGYRPLIERVEVWVIDEAHSSMVYPSLTHPNKPTEGQFTDVELDPGCTYLLLNRRSGIAKNDDWAHYLAQRLNPFSLLRGIPDQKVIELGLLHAHGLKPGWHHSGILQSNLMPPAIENNEKAQVTVAYHSMHPLFPYVIQSMKSLLKEDGISLKTVKYDLTVENPDEVDIWLKPMGLANHRKDALIGWLLGYSDIDIMSNQENFSNWKKMVSDWRSQPNQTFPAKELAKQLVQTQQLIPMFHCWLGVSQDQCGSLQNATCNALGWFDFSQVWVKPE
ncbi:SgrR family transcriptional regulator [Vibrio sp. CK2-1]|uniref:SgrR family transcriptional regulator n=1 Tax=Vibrio sp. CK2-1 TaxID=2912249 RepID=UPI001F3B5DF2|nr:SgrR family transcriptional regulator [Vibrio sp. CK2-1]MCF7355027.1 SgrR family transcriptional regulator [Vibrio sp. CK2-1]